MKEAFVSMPDGVRLFTRIIAPEGEKHPIVYIRTPYADKRPGIEIDFHERFLDRGFALVIQHCRGTGKSEGDCIPYENEREDGLCTLEYIRSLDFYCGEIYLFGGSYLSSVHLLYLSSKPKDIKGAVLEIQTDRMYFRNYMNGCNYNFCNAEWWFGMMKRKYPSPSLSEINRMPYKDIAFRAVGEDVSPFTANLINDKYNDFWKNDPRDNVVDYIDFPVLFVDGWYDFYIGGMFSMWERLPKDTKQKSAFIVGPWDHAVRTNETFEYKSLLNGNLPIDFDVKWFECIRNKESYEYAELGKTNCYLIGDDSWFSEEYPRSDMRKIRTAFCDLQSSCKSDCLEYTYDPKSKNDLFVKKGLWRAKDTENLSGVTSFCTEAFKYDTTFFGEIRFELTVSSDRDDTAFYIAVNFSDGGEFYPLTEAITSVSHFCPEYKAGEKLTLKFKTAPIAFRVKAGERIRLDLASSGGKYVPHSNTKCHWACATDTRIAKNTVFLCESYVDLPIK